MKRAQGTIRKLDLVFRRGRTRGMKSNRIEAEELTRLWFRSWVDHEIPFAYVRPLCAKSGHARSGPELTFEQVQR
jgi:hypothetical protein